MANDPNVAVSFTSTPDGTTATISLQARGPGLSGNRIALSTSYTSQFSPASFTTTPASGNLAGGTDGVAGSTVYDQGNVSATIAGFTATVPYSQTGNNSAPLVASALATALSVPSSPVTASSSGAQLTVTYKNVGPAGNTPVSVTSQSTQTQWTFPANAFNASGSLSGGLNPEGTSLDFNYFVTQYAYDGLGNLLQVTQKGDPSVSDSSQWRVRQFSYDSLSRLLAATNPESGTISYSYDADGNMLQKTSPAPNQTGSATQTVSYCYDFLNRVTGKGYGGQSCPLATPVVSYAYDAGANAVGKLTSLADQAGTASYTYDVLGRMATETRSIAGITKSTGYTYNLDGSIKTLTYPSGRVVTYTPDSAGRLISAVDGNGTNYVSSASYNPDGSLKNLINGSTPALSQNFQYTPRLQLCRITALTSGSLPTSCTDTQNVGNIMDRGYNFNFGAGDNGNVISITNYRDANRSQAFTYDSLNRLTSAWSSANTGDYSWGENYSIDAWGNLQIAPMSGKAHGGNFQLSANVQNRPTGMSYDAAGNLMSNNSGINTYDEENRLKTAAGTSYIYDGDGERVLKSNASTGAPIKRYWSMGGSTLAEDDGTGNPTAEYIYLGSKRIARVDLPANTAHYYLSDHLDSTSMVVSAAGAIEEESDYYPFGTEVVVASGVNKYKFTGKERDTETGLDYFSARYYGNAFGRFITPDPLMSSGHPYDPQSWNRYTYVLNNPLRYTDPTGLYTFGSCNGDKDTCAGYQKRFNQSVDNLKKAAGQLDSHSKEGKQLNKIIKRLGEEGKGGPKINFGDAGKDKAGNSNLGVTIGNSITLNYQALDQTEKGFQLNAAQTTSLDTALTGHEGGHLSNVGFPGLSFIEHGERTALFSESATYQGLHNTDTVFKLWDESWAKVDRQQMETKRDNAIQKELDRQAGTGKDDNPHQ
jgi:RHS repeat-associated protein